MNVSAWANERVRTYDGIIVCSPVADAEELIRMQIA